MGALTASSQSGEPLQDSNSMRQLLAYADVIVPTPDKPLLNYLNEMRTLASSARFIRAELTGRLFDRLERASGRGELGLDFAEWLNPRGFGPMSLLWENAATLGESIRISRTYITLENSAITLDFKEEGDDVALVDTLSPSVKLGARPYMDSLVALAIRLARIVCGRDVAPGRIELTASAPRSISAYRQFFRAPVLFSSDRDAIVFPRALLSVPAARSNPELLAFLESRLVELSNEWHGQFLERAERLIEGKLAGGHATHEAVARALSMTPRTLQRRLKAEGWDFAKLQDQARRRRVIAYVKSNRRPRLAKLSLQLGYADNTGASRFIRTKMGATLKALPREVEEPHGISQ